MSDFPPLVKGRLFQNETFIYLLKCLCLSLGLGMGLGMGLDTGATAPPMERFSAKPGIKRLASSKLYRKDC